MSSLWVHIIVNLVGNLPFNFLLRTHNFDELRYRYMQRVVLPLFTSLINHVLSACKYRISMLWRSTKFAVTRDKCMKRIIHRHRKRTGTHSIWVRHRKAPGATAYREPTDYRVWSKRDTENAPINFRYLARKCANLSRNSHIAHASTLQSCSLQNALNFISGIGMIPKLF